MYKEMMMNDNLESNLLMLKALDADLSPWSSCVWLQPRLTVEAAHWLINYTLSLRDYFYYYI